MYKEQLQGFGLSRAQAEVYSALLEHGRQKAGEISKWVSIKRGLVYKGLEDLETMELIEHHSESGKADTFSPKHPENLRAYVEERLRKARDAEILFSSFMPSLGTAFNLVSGKPGIRIHEGLDGLRILYKDIIDSGKPIKLIRSFHDRENPEVVQLIDDHIKVRIRRGISAKVITHPTIDGAKFAASTDNDWLVERRIIADAKFRSPAQVIVYGDKVSIVDMESLLITTIIENKAIRQSFEAMFDYIWSASEDGHNEIICKYREANRKSQMHNPNFK